ncbi:MAG: DNA repair protein RecN [Thermodesulfobacteriota bacterium]
MLLELGIKDFAIIEGLNISFGPGLNIFTGETGAGKSIIMDAIALLLGDRASGGLIREGSEEAQVEAAFDTSGSEQVKAVLEEAGIPYDGELVIRRVIQRAGRNRIYVNGSLATLVTLTEVASRLIDIYGQSEHQSLTRPEEHVEVLDAFGNVEKLRAEMAAAYRGYATAQREYDALVADSKETAGRKDFLCFQLEEITAAAPAAGEDEELKKEAERLRHAEKIKSVTYGAESEIYSDAGSITERLGALAKALREVSAFDERLVKTTEAIETSLFQLEDAGTFLRDYAGSVEADPDALERVEARLDTLNRLKKKYGPSLEEVLARKDAMEGELSGLDDLDGRLRELEEKAAAARKTAEAAALKLRSEREAAAPAFKAGIERQLSTLGMKEAVFEVIMEAETFPDGSMRFNERGADRVTFFISPNPGEGVKPLARIASGGELSRIMLAMKSVCAATRVSTLVFDEIDTGVGGAMAQAVGMKLKEVSTSNQVLCITHLPQIAAFADRHFVVAKETAGGRTSSSVRELNGDEAVEQISVMLGGMKVTDVTRKHARELLGTARELATDKGQGRPGPRGEGNTPPLKGESW